MSRVGSRLYTTAGRGSGSTGSQGVPSLVPKVEALVVGLPLLPESEDYLDPLVGQGSGS